MWSCCPLSSDDTMSTDSSTSSSFWSQPLSIQWRKALVSLPRAVPVSIIRYTSPEGPQPFIISLPSRGKYLIPMYAFVPHRVEPSQLEHSGLPVVLDFHGGGFVLGSCLEQAPFCAKLARDLGAVVLTIDYRMGPIDKHPSAIEDGEDVLSAVLDPSAKGYHELREHIAKKIKETHKNEWKNDDKHSHVYEMLKQDPSRILDTHRIALSGFSSGGNLALNLALSIPTTPPHVQQPWPSRFPEDYKFSIPLLLYYPSFDCRKLPSERPCPSGLAPSSGFWSAANDMLMPTYLPRSQADHPRASPGLAEIKNGGLHDQAKIQLVLPELDSLAEQSETWVKKMDDEGRASDLQVDRFKAMKHGWTQMPEGWLSEDEKKARTEAFEKTTAFIASYWRKFEYRHSFSGDTF